MKTLPSKELLSEVLGKDAKFHKYIEDRSVVLYIQDIADCREINIYELAHKCKEWASLYGYDLFSHRFNEHASYAYLDLDMKNVVPSNNKYIFIGNYIKEFEADTEPEAIFKACEWIMEQTK
ncbi:MAG: hypothetical protein ACMV1K_00155 [Sulfurospirillum sp.]